MTKLAGKIVGGVLGFALGGPWGAALGAIIGHSYDSRRIAQGNDPWASVSASASDFSGNVQQATFTMGVIVLGAKMAKADGRVTRAEIAAFKRVFQVKPEQEAHVGRLFDQARLSADGFEPYAFQLAQIFRRKPEVLEEVLSGLFVIGTADDSTLSAGELSFLKRVAGIFGFSSNDFIRIAARSGVNMAGQRRSPEATPDDSYTVLGVSAKASNDEIKTAYRSLIRKHHPDKLVAQGMPPEFIANANEKMKRINIAYDSICKARGIK